MAPKKEPNRWAWVAVLMGVLGILGWVGSNWVYPIMTTKFATKSDFSKLESADIRLGAEDIKLGTRLTRVETNYQTIKDDVGTIKQDIKKILERLPKK